MTSLLQYGQSLPSFVLNRDHVSFAFHFTLQFVQRVIVFPPSHYLSYSESFHHIIQVVYALVSYILAMKSYEIYNYMWRRIDMRMKIFCL